jgi:signal transduction histidine kinase
VTVWKFQHRIALWMGLCATGALVLFALGTLLILRPGLMRLMDEELAEEAIEFQTAWSESPASLDKWINHPWLGWRIVRADGVVMNVGLQLSDDLVRRAAASRGPRNERDAGQRWRVQAFPLGGETLVLGHNHAMVDVLVNRLLWAYLYTLPIAVAMIALLGSWAGRRAIGPLGRLAHEVETIGPRDLDRRVPVPAASDALQQLAVGFNAMLARLQQAFAQSRNFAGDASHELRTPLTIMRGEVESLLRAPGMTADARGQLVSLQEEIARLDRVTEHLLQLARFDAGQGLGQRVQLNLSQLIAEIMEDAELLAAAREVRLELGLEPDVTIWGDVDHLRRLLFNLLDNATRYNRPGGYVRCVLSADLATARLTLTNSGQPIPPEKRARLFERFYRATREGADTGGHGLGLSLARQIARAHGGELQLGEAGAEEVTFELSLPRGEPSATVGPDDPVRPLAPPPDPPASPSGASSPVA